MGFDDSACELAPISLSVVSGTTTMATASATAPLPSEDWVFPLDLGIAKKLNEKKQARIWSALRRMLKIDSSHGIFQAYPVMGSRLVNEITAATPYKMAAIIATM